MPALCSERPALIGCAVPPPSEQPPPPWPALRAGRRGSPLSLLGLLSLLFLGAWLSCNPSPARTQNPSTLWVSFGQTELDLILTDTEPPYY